MLAGELAETVIGDEVVVAARHSGDERTQSDREDVFAPKAAPDRPELVRGRHRLRAGGHESRIERARRSADQQVGDDAAFVQRAQHADLQRTETGSPRQDERSARTTGWAETPPDPADQRPDPGRVDAHGLLRNALSSVRRAGLAGKLFGSDVAQRPAEGRA